MPIDNASRQAIAARLKELRLRFGFKDQRSFAQAIGVTGGLVGQWETGAKVPGRANLRKIAELTSVPIDYLLGNAPAPVAGRSAGCRCRRNVGKGGSPRMGRPHSSASYSGSFAWSPQSFRQTS